MATSVSKRLPLNALVNSSAFTFGLTTYGNHGLKELFVDLDGGQEQQSLSEQVKVTCLATMDLQPQELAGKDTAMFERCAARLEAFVRESAEMRLRYQISLSQSFSQNEFAKTFPSDGHHCQDTMEGRCFLLYNLTQYMLASAIPGDYVETGVHVGQSAAAVAQALSEANSPKRMWLYDSFEGMPNADREKDGLYATRVDGSSSSGSAWGANATPQIVLARLLALKRPKRLLKIRQGWFSSTFKLKETDPPLERIAFLMIDCDWYESVMASLERFYASVTDGGIVMLDDYGYWEGSRRAVGDFFRKHPEYEFPLFERYGISIVYWYKDLTHNRFFAQSNHRGDESPGTAGVQTSQAGVLSLGGIHAQSESRGDL